MKRSLASSENLKMNLFVAIQDDLPLSGDPSNLLITCSRINIETGQNMAFPGGVI